MSSWTAADSAAGAPLWACASAGLAPSSANRTNLFEDSTLSNFISGSTIGLFNYAAGEIIAGSHQGWVLKTTGSGGRASRVTGETLVCLTSNT
jgi:hypothetical protein